MAELNNATMTVDLKVIGAKVLVDHIDAWFAEHFHGHPAMRDTDAFNHVRSAVDDLKRRLEPISADPAPAAAKPEEEA